MKKAKIRAIDQGTRYDISGSIRQLVRDVERGDLGKVTDIVVIVASKKPLNHASARGVYDTEKISMRHWGTGEISKAHWMLSTAKTRIEPS